MALRFSNPVPGYTYGNGDKLHFYEAGTSTDLATYSDSALSSANTNPVVCDANGLLPSTFLQDQLYKVVCKNSADVQQWERDPIGKIIAANNQIGGNVIAPHEGLVVKQTSVTTVDIDATKLLLADSSDDTYIATTVNLTADITASGINGLDTGAEATSTWYHLWVIYNSTTVASLISASSTTPTVPVGYTFKAYVGAVYNDSSGDFRWFEQLGSIARMLRQQVLSNGNATSSTSIDLSGYVPSTAVAILLSGRVKNSAGTSNSWLNIIDSSDNGMICQLENSRVGGTELTVPIGLFPESGQAIRYSTGSSDHAAYIHVYGWSFQ